MLRWFAVSWYGIENAAGDYVGIWDHDPKIDASKPLDNVTTNGSDGVVRLNVHWNSSLFPKDINSAVGCQPFWGGYVQNDKVIHSECFRMRPKWMEEIKHYIKDMGIADILLPGSHDAGSYWSIKKFNKWFITQDENLWKQLILGSRYLDMRISYYPETKEKLFVNHAWFQVRPLKPYLEQVLKFVKSTNEIAIFDIHKLPVGFDEHPAGYKLLNDELLKYFEDIMVPNNLAPNPTLETIWKTGTNLIVTYNHATTEGYFWPTVKHAWGNVNTISNLQNYFKKTIPKLRRNGKIWSAMAEFTPTAFDKEINRWGGLRGAANITNPLVSKWLRTEWWKDANVVAMDFLPSSNVVNFAVDGNIARAICRNML